MYIEKNILLAHVMAVSILLLSGCNTSGDTSSQLIVPSTLLIFTGSTDNVGCEPLVTEDIKAGTNMVKTTFQVFI